MARSNGSSEGRAFEKDRVHFTKKTERFPSRIFRGGRARESTGERRRQKQEDSLLPGGIHRFRAFRELAQVAQRGVPLLVGAIWVRAVPGGSGRGFSGSLKRRFLVASRCNVLKNTHMHGWLIDPELTRSLRQVRFFPVESIIECFLRGGRSFRKASPSLSGSLWPSGRASFRGRVLYGCCLVTDS